MSTPYSGCVAKAMNECILSPHRACSFTTCNQVTKLFMKLKSGKECMQHALHYMRKCHIRALSEQVWKPLMAIRAHACFQMATVHVACMKPKHHLIFYELLKSSGNERPLSWFAKSCSSTWCSVKLLNYTAAVFCREKFVQVQECVFKVLKNLWIGFSWCKCTL